MGQVEGKKGVWVYDIETLSNCFTYTAIERDTRELVQYTIWKDVNQVEELLNHLDSILGQIGFNNLDFDYPVLHHLLLYRNELSDNNADSIAKELYRKAQEVISEQWSSIKPKYVKIPQLDLFRIWHYNNRARMTSLKKLEIAMRYENVQDMPYKHYETIETAAQAQEILDYNVNDVEATLNFYEKTKPKVELRKGLYDRYGLRCMNYPDSKIGEELMLKLYCDATGEPMSQTRKLRTRRSVFKFKECLPEYTELVTTEGKQLLDYLKGIEVEEIKGSFKHSFSFKQQLDFHYDLGTGGIHGCIKSGVYEETDTHMIVDVDVASLYPSLAIVNGLYPKHLGEVFLDVYENGLLKPRLKAKKEGDKVMNLGFKLSLNSVYGKSNSEYSWLYDPLYTLKTTLAGQISLVMLSEMLVTSVPDLTMLQINTDGLTAIIPRTEKRNFYNQCKAWENKTNLVLEYVAYKRMIIRDVNSYIAESKDGYIKYKGALKPYSEMIKDDEYHKSLSQSIVQRAVAEYFLNGTPVEETVMKCDDIYDFCKTFNASHGWTCETVDSDNNTDPQQKTNRYYVSTNGKTFRKLKDDRIIEIEAGGTLVTIFNKFVLKHDFSEYHVDYDYYIAECYKLVHKIDGTEERLLREERERKEKDKRLKQEDKFLKYCVNKRPTERQYRLYAKDWLLKKYSDHEIKIKPSPKRKSKKR